MLNVLKLNPSRVMVARRGMQLLAHEMGCTDEQMKDTNINELYLENRHYMIPTKSRLNFTSPYWKALKNKEQGDWKNLTEEDMHQLYRGHFRYTIAEMEQPTDAWKSIFGATLVATSLALLIHWYLHKFILPPYHKGLTDPERVRKIVKKQLQQHQGEVVGLASMWDYENNRWK